MRYVVASLAALVLVAAAVAFAQEPEPAPAPTPDARNADTRRPRTPPAPTSPSPVDQPSVPPDFAAVQWRKSHSKALGQPARKGRLVRRRAAPRARRGLLHLGPDLQPDPEPRVAALGHRPADPHRAHRPPRVPDRARQRPARRDHGPVAHARRQVRAQLRRARPRLAPERARRRHPLPAQGRDRGARRSSPQQVDRKLAQDLVDRFVAAGAVKVFVGPHLHLKGPKNVVVPLIYHDDHLHVPRSLATS